MGEFKKKRKKGTLEVTRAYKEDHYPGCVVVPTGVSPQSSVCFFPPKQLLWQGLYLLFSKPIRNLNDVISTC